MPDLNSVPASPHPHKSSSRRQSSNLQMATASAIAQTGSSSSPGNLTPSSSLNILPSNQTAVNHQQHGSTSVSSVPSPQLPSTQLAQHPESASGPGPLRHPRPMTASELHTELEKEQEAMVCHRVTWLHIASAAPPDANAIVSGQPPHSRTVPLASHSQRLCSV